MDELHGRMIVVDVGDPAQHDPDEKQDVDQPEEALDDKDDVHTGHGMSPAAIRRFAPEIPLKVNDPPESSSGGSKNVSAQTLS